MKQVLTFLLVFITGFAFSQPQSITLTFTARIDTYGEYVSLDSIKIINRIRNCDTMLYAPDTSFVLYYTVGIQNQNSPEKSMRLSNFYPNPAKDGKTVFVLNKDTDGFITIKLSNIDGTILLQKKQYVLSGKNKFELRLSKSGLFLITVSDNKVIITKKIINNVTTQNINRINLLSCTKNHKNTKRNAINPWWFEPGDTLWYVGYAKTLQEINGSDVMEDTPKQDSLITLRILEGIPCPDEVAVKYAGHLYPTVKIKERCWLKENLVIGTMISGDSTMTDNGIVEKYCYDNNPANCEVYGGLYQWDELMQYTTQEKSQGICPNGWYVPTIDEWNTMTQGYTGDDFKERGNAHWNYGSNGLNTTGFTALPAGGWDFYNKVFRLLTKDAPFFSSTKFPSPYQWIYFKEFNMGSYTIYGNANINDGLSVRCIKDENK